MAISRASFEKIPIHLVTSIPSIETYNNIQNKKFRHIKIFKRFNDYPLPKTKIINLKLFFFSNINTNLYYKYLYKYYFTYFPQILLYYISIIIYFKTFLNLMTESESELLRAL